MKKILVIIILIVSAFVASLFLAGCGKETVIIMPASTTIETTIATTTTEPTTITVEETPNVPDTDLYLKMVYKDTSFDNFMTDFQLIELGTTICQAFGRGMTLTEVVTIINQVSVKNGLSSEETSDFSEITALAVVALCPEYSYLFE